MTDKNVPPQSAITSVLNRSGSPSIFMLDGIDHLGKTTLVEGIKDALGFFYTVHLEKPKLLKHYAELVSSGKVDELLDIIGVVKNKELFLYQFNTFINMFTPTLTKVIYDRSHLGEAVYSDLYRGYRGDYVFDIEGCSDLKEHARLILLTEDFSISNHFKDDGLSFDPSKRQVEQTMFIDAFNKSSIVDKRIINVTAPDGSFRPKEDILQEAIS